MENDRVQHMPAADAPEPAPRGDRAERVAVVAVHGVGKHKPGASAQAMADLLLGLNAHTGAAAGSPYAGFDTTKIEVPLPEPSVFEVQQPKTGSVWDRLRTMFEERRGFFADRFQLKSWFGRREVLCPLDLNDEFMAIQLGEYKGNTLSSRYESVRLEGRRSEPGGQAGTAVDIYEMYWADLAKRNSSVVRFFMSFYQLLIHLTSLGRTAIDHVALEHAGSIPWLLLQRSYNYATRVLTLGMFNLLVLLPVVVFAPITGMLEKGTEVAAATVVLAVVVAGVAGVLMSYCRPLFWNRQGFFFLLFASVVGGSSVGAAIAARYFFATHSHASPVVLAIVWWAAAFVIIYFVVFKKYDQVRAGAKETGLISMAGVAAGFLGCLRFASQLPDQAGQVYNAAAFMMIQYLFLVLRGLWLALLLLVLLAWITEFICIRCTKVKDERARARAAFRTGRVALGVPTALLLLLTMFAYSGAFYYTGDRVPLYQKDKPLPEAPLPTSLQWVSIRSDEAPQLLQGQVKSDANRQRLAALLVQSAPLGLPLALASLAVGFFLLALTAAPSALQEAKHPLSSTNRASQALGGWLSGAFAAFPATIYCFWMSAFGIPVLYIAVATWNFLAYHPNESYMFHLYSWRFHGFIASLMLRSGPIIAAMMVFLMTAGKAISKSASTVLDTILDVDNYLRTSPANNTPRASIVERYVGLLHFLHRQGYDRIVIVAHSLGSLISADLLRFLNHRRIPSLSDYACTEVEARRIPIQLFTMGSPLRQLLNQFFPNLYHYVRQVPDNAGEAPRPPVPVPPGIIPDNAMPNVNDLGISMWVNAYRSGDYVGRSLWLDAWMERTDGGEKAGKFPAAPTATIFNDGAAQRMETCIGFGAHTHYWDRSAPDVGAILDSLIRQGCRQC